MDNKVEVRHAITDDQWAAIKDLLPGKKGDRAYDSNAVVNAIQEAGATACIPPKVNRVVKRAYDKKVYKTRSKVECFINRLKQYRRVATQYEKRATNFLGFVLLAATMISLG